MKKPVIRLKYEGGVWMAYLNGSKWISGPVLSRLCDQICFILTSPI